jgi:hypothetical protein
MSNGTGFRLPSDDELDPDARELLGSLQPLNVLREQSAPRREDS